VQELLLAWFSANGRDLPWRRTTDPYAILVSEVMLQQTQVDRVIPRYERWLARWPTVDALASASPAEVIVEWQGLGYNRRALSLYRAAVAIAERGWPADLTELPGVGPYTAAAIRNFAFGEDVVPRDVNVERVERRTGHNFTGAAAQALMDLGATVCVARIPRCGVCPLTGECPSVGTRDEPARKQTRFEGSFRQRRAVELRLVAGRPRSVDEVDREVARSLAADGLVVIRDGVVELPGRDAA
jgi:A/G-specific adenine glycosylase